ncbi:ferredoxin family protein [Desulfogranum marinum]|uniref:4Fe-4S dicluster domain-containing protein n=1 Tax=Desulfogranum marinum TaxID=453220 RepID=UPI0019625116|nr:4Fe-4S binding protein [Desulfogranum marinum]MBM9512915.1 4Fe-4S binding protein [Desulfogranum marinum]
MAFWREPLDAQEIQVTKGIVYIIEDRCKGCGYCIEFCPKEILAFADKFNNKGYHPPFAVRPDDCVNCHYCEIICPEFAIYSAEDPQSSTTTPPVNPF